jgi:hypothetical protein
MAAIWTRRVEPAPRELRPSGVISVSAIRLSHRGVDLPCGARREQPRTTVHAGNLEIGCSAGPPGAIPGDCNSHIQATQNPIERRLRGGPNDEQASAKLVLLCGVTILLAADDPIGIYMGSAYAFLGAVNRRDRILPGWAAAPTPFLPLAALPAFAGGLRGGCLPLPEQVSV